MILIPTYIKSTPIGPIQQCAVTSPSTWRSPPSFYTVSPMLSACRDAVVMAPSSFRQCDRHSIHALFEQIPQAPFSLRAIHPLVSMDEFVDGGGDVDSSSCFHAIQHRETGCMCIKNMAWKPRNQRPWPLYRRRIRPSTPVDGSPWRPRKLGVLG